MSAWLQTKSWEEAKEAIVKSKGVAIVPIGSVEQHSYHLPLGTDTYVAMTIAEEAAEKTGAVLTPPVWFGWSPHHMVLPGTVTIRPEVLSELTYDIIESLNAHGLNKIILINGHRIVNVVWMQICAQRAQSKLGCIGSDVFVVRICGIKISFCLSNERTSKGGKGLSRFSK